MARPAGVKVQKGERRRAIRQLQHLIAVGVSDDEANAQVAESFNVSQRTARTWLARAYTEMTAEACVEREKLLGAALRRRRLIMARSAKEGDWRTALAAADSEAKLLGLNAPIQTEHHVLIDKVNDMSKAVVEVVRDFFADRPEERARFVMQLRQRLNAQLTQRPEKLAIVIDEPAALEAGSDEPVEAFDARSPGTIVDVSPTTPPSQNDPPPA